jgi:hypothetical protein
MFTTKPKKYHVFTAFVLVAAMASVLVSGCIQYTEKMDNDNRPENIQLACVGIGGTIDPQAYEDGIRCCQDPTIEARLVNTSEVLYECVAA